MSVRAKFKVDVIELKAESGTVRLTPVIGGSEENKKFYRWTPAGEISLCTVSNEVLKQFEPGKEYYVDFSPA